MTTEETSPRRGRPPKYAAGERPKTDWKAYRAKRKAEGRPLKGGPAPEGYKRKAAASIAAQRKAIGALRISVWLEPNDARALANLVGRASSLTKLVHDALAAYDPELPEPPAFAFDPETLTERRLLCVSLDLETSKRFTELVKLEVAANGKEGAISRVVRKAIRAYYAGACDV